MAIKDPLLMVVTGWILGSAVTALAIKGAVARTTKFSRAVRVGTLGSVVVALAAYLVFAIVRYFV